MTEAYRPHLYRVALVREAPVGQPTVAENPAAAAAFLWDYVAAAHADDGREHFGIVLLSARHHVIGVTEISIGCLTASLVHPRECFAPAILAPAVAIVLWHTHPSGDPEPSAEDLASTRRLCAAGSLLGIEVLDHLVLGMGTGRHVSMKDRGIV